MEFRAATTDDALLLAELNKQLIDDEGHRNPMTVAQLADRMVGWLEGEYRATIFSLGGEVVGYTLFRHEPEHIYIRHFYIVRQFWRRGFGRAAIEWLRGHDWAGSKRLRLDVLIGNAEGIAFWRAAGFADYCLTMEANPGALSNRRLELAGDVGPRVEVAIRLATLADLGAVRDIYNHYVAQSTCTFQIEQDTEAERLAWFRDRTVAHPVTVAELGGEVIGWGALSPWKSRCAYDRTVEASVYIRHDQHRRGIGRALLLDLIERAREAGHHTVIGGACTEQVASLALQESLGFERVACFRQVGYKFGRWLDVAYMQLFLGPHSHVEPGD